MSFCLNNSLCFIHVLVALVVPLLVAGHVCKDSSECALMLVPIPGSELWKRESACQALKNDTSVSSWFGELGFCGSQRGILGACGETNCLLDAESNRRKWKLSVQKVRHLLMICVNVICSWNF